MTIGECTKILKNRAWLLVETGLVARRDYGLGKGFSVRKLLELIHSFAYLQSDKIESSREI